MSHPADADYSAMNEPNVDDLTRNLESAMLLSDVFNGRRRVSPDGRGIRVDIDPSWSLPPMITRATPPNDDFRPGATEVLRPDFVDVTRPVDYDKKLDVVIKAQQTEPGQLGTVDRALAQDCLLVIRDRVRRLRDSGVGDTAIGTHACNSIDLGLVGIAKLLGAE